MKKNKKKLSKKKFINKKSIRKKVINKTALEYAIIAIKYVVEAERRNANNDTIRDLPYER
jgi:hypothetical protein